MRLQAPFFDIVDHLVSKLLQRESHIRHTLQHDFFQLWHQFHQSVIFWVLEPTFNVYPVLGLQLEILGDIINYDHFTQIPSKLAQILYMVIRLAICVLPILPIMDPVISIQSIQNPIRVIL